MLGTESSVETISKCFEEVLESHLKCVDLLRVRAVVYRKSMAKGLRCFLLSVLLPLTSDIPFLFPVEITETIEFIGT